jgi:hypothetical protein
MNLFRKFGLPGLLMLACAIGLFAQSEAIISDRLPADKSLQDTKLFDYYTPLEDYLVSGDSDQVISASTYSFLPQSSVALEDMSSGTTQMIAASQDDTVSTVINLGFDFWFDGVRYSQISCNANGLCRLGGTVVTTAFDNASATTGFATTTNAPKIATYFEDLCTGTTGKVHYKVVGSAPSRRFVVEWQNMQVTRGTGCAGVGAGTFQLWLNESTAAVNPGAIQFVYGTGIVASATADAGASIGLQSGAATNFASVTAASDSVSYTTHDALNAAGIAAGESFTFTTNVPNAPTGLTFSPVTQTSIQLNWTDNAANEVGYAIYRSTDGTNYSFLTQTAASAVNYNDTNLLPGVTYFYRVYAASEGALSGVLSGSQSTGAAGSVSCNGAGGLWSATTTWAGGTVPTGGDNVTIGTGCTVTVDTAATALSLTVQSGGTVEFESATARTLTVVLGVTIDSGGTLRSNTTGTVTTHQLVVGADLTNNGTLDFSTNADTAGAELRFTGAANNSFAGTGATTDLRLLTLQKGAGTVNSSSPTLDVNLSNMTVRGVSTGGISGFLNTAAFNGIVKFSGTNTFSDQVFQTAGYSIPSTGGVWLNNPNFTVAPLNGSPTLTGLLRITQGTLNIGTSTGNSMGFATGSTIIVEGGAVNAAGRFGVSAATSIINFSMSGGTVTVQTAGNTSTTLAGFDLGTSTASTISLSGGNIIVQLANTGGSGPRDYRNQAGTGISGVSGGTLQLGNAASGAAKTFTMRGVVPNLIISNASAGHTGQWDTTLANFNNISRNITINPTTTLNLNNVVFLFYGTTLTNNGTLTHNGASSNTVIFTDYAPALYTGSGTVTAPLTALAIQANQGFTIDASSTGMTALAVRLFFGSLINANKLTVGNGGTTTATVQIGNTTTPTTAGTFDSTPTFNPGSGGIVFSYLRTGGSRTIGPEMAPTRIINNLTYDDNAGGRTLTLAGGNLTVNSTLALTNGVIVTDAANILKANGTTTRSTGFVDGPLARDITVTGAFTYHVGDGIGYSPVAVNTTAGTGSLTIQAIATAQPNIPNPSKALSRHWKLAGTGITSDLTFNYLDPADVPATATEANFVIVKYDGSFTQPGGTVDTTANTATITGVTSFSDWTLAEPSALTAPGTLALSSSTYSSNENSGSVAVTVNRTGGTDGAVTVDYAFSGGTATGGAACAAGIDYVNTGGTVSFANGEASKSFNVTLCGDTDVEPDETFNLTLSNPTGGATIGSPSSAVVTILNDDTASGPVTVTATAGTASGTYATLSAAIAAVNDGTHQGDIVISINQSTTEPGTIVLNSTGAGAALYTSLLIRPTADGLTVAGASAQGRGLIELNGADNVTINGDNPNSAGTNRNLTLQNTAANTVTFTSVIRIALAASVTTADGNSFRNLNILGSATGRNIGTANTTTGTENNGFGILAGLGATGATTAPAAIASVTTGAPTGTTATNLVISNNGVTTTARGISVNGAVATVYPGLQITGNTVGNPTAGAVDQVYTVGITAQGSPDGLISGNTVWVEGFAPTAVQGINVSTNSTVGTFTVELNKVNRARNNNITTFGAYGINLGGSTNHVVRNNFVSGVINSQTGGTGAFSTTFGAFGIRVLGTGHDIYHNSVHLYGAMPGTTSTNLTAALAIVGTTQTGLDVRNNIFSNQITGGNPATPGTRNVSVFLPTGGTSAMNLTLNNNAYFAGSDALNRLAQVGTTFGTGEFLVGNFDPTSTTPATNFRAYTSTLSAAGTNDNASFASSSPPPFTSDVDLHIPAGTATRLESGGAAVGVTTDIDNDARNATTPDIGADEFAGNPAPANDIAAVAFVFPANGSTIPTGSTFNPVARFNNNGTATQTNVTVRFRIIDSSMTVIYNQTATIATIAPLQNVDVSFPSTSIATPGTYTMEASVELPGDANPGNNTITGTFNTVSPVGGTVTVGAGGTYPSLTNPGGLFAALNLAGISGDLTVNITSDLTGETGAVALNQLSEVGAGGYTVTIKPSGAPRVISGSGATNNGLINLNGADRIVFDGSLSGGTDRSLTITNTQTGTSTVFWIKSASAANGANNNTIKNCIINGAGTTTAQTTAGILAGSGTTIGGPAEAPNNNNTVTNNHIYRVQNSLYNQGNVGFDQNWTITNNEFGSTVEADKNRFRGMLMGNANNFTISGNTVLGVTNFDATAGANTGIQLAFTLSNGTVTNNRISNVKNLSATGTGAFGMQLGATTTTNVLIANNFIWDIQAAGSATVASNGHGITINGAATTGAYKIYHNSINLNTNQASGTTAALNITAAVVAAGAIDLRNNILANTQTSGATRFAVFSAAAANVFSTINYNDYFAQNVGSLGGTVRPTLADWQTATGQDANSKAVDPLFVSPTDLHLQPTSPLLGQGIGGLGVTTDIDGQTRDNPPDIGADEVLAAATPGSVQFGSATYTVGEAGGTTTLTVTRTGGTSGAISVAYATANGTATGGASCGAGVDYVTAGGTLNWADGDAASKTFNVTICNDALFEGNETFTATLSGATGGATIGTPNPATVTITDDDPAPSGTITVSDVRVFEGNTGGANAVFTVTYSGPNPASASVNYATASGTAQSGVDFVAVNGTLSFASSATQTVTVPIIGKSLKEANETFFLNLSGAVNASIADAQGVAIIVDEDRAYVSDFDRDLYSDVSVYRPSNNGWYILNSSNATPNILTFGSAGDRPVPGDYDGDGRADVAVFRASEGKWYVILSTTATVQITNWGASGDKAVQGDYDGDGKTDFAVFRPSTGTWWVLRSSDSGSYTVPFGISTDKPMQGDYDGDFKTDVAVYRNGTWYVTFSSNNTVGVQNFGVASDLPVSGDFDGDGKYDLAVFRPSIGDWFVFNSLTGTASQVHWGANGDVPVPADYDRDGTTDLAIFRPSTGEWYVLRSSNNSYFSVQWGLNGDIPVPAAYIAQ